MTLGEFIEKNNLPENFDLNKVPVKHPETGQKIYLLSAWHTGFWFRRKPGGGNGQMWPCQYLGSLLQLEVHKDAKKEVAKII